jgi:quinol-cytochrome oxidoreductase complex cytochrome b subunit
MSEASGGERAPGSTGRTGVPPGTGRADWIGWLERRLNLTEIFSFVTHFGLVYTRVDTSRPVRDVAGELVHEAVPSYTRGPRILGLLAVILFGLEAVTGVLLAYYYRPTPEAAYESTRSIVRDLPAGWFIHQIHSWGAYLLVAVVVMRLLRLFWDGLYRAPREVLWLSAVIMTWLVLQLDFTGRLLAWDTHSYWSTVRGLEVIWALPIAGPVLSFLLGGHVVNEDVLIRFYVLHMMVLPIFYGIFLYLTFATLRRVGLSPEPATGARVSTLRDHIYSMVILTVILFAILVTLSTLLPLRFAPQADPYATPSGVRPPWYMFAPYAIIQRFPLPQAVSGLLLLAAAFAVLLLPFWLRSPIAQNGRRLRIAGLAVLGLWIALSVAGALMERT